MPPAAAGSGAPAGMPGRMPAAAPEAPKEPAAPAVPAAPAAPEVERTVLPTGAVVVSQTNPAGYYTVFTDTKDVWHYHTDPTLNEFNLNHVLIDGIKYSWEDIYGLGDRDFNDVVMNIEKSNATAAPGATLKSGTNMFLTADRGFIRQVDGLIQAVVFTFLSTLYITEAIE